MISPLFSLAAYHLKLKRDLKASNRLFVYGKAIKRHVPSSGMQAGNSPQALSSDSGPDTLSLSSLICSFEFHKPKLRVVDDFQFSQISAFVCPAICATTDVYKN